MAKKKKPRINKDALKPESSELFITCFTDASYCDQTGAWGICYWIKAYGADEPIVKSMGGINKNYNSTTAELRALNEARDYICSELTVDDKVVVIQCDNESALQRLDISKFQKKGARFVKKKHVYGHAVQKGFFCKDCNVKCVTNRERVPNGYFAHCTKCDTLWKDFEVIKPNVGKRSRVNQIVDIGARKEMKKYREVAGGL